VWLLEHVPDPQAVVNECARCLRPGGRLVAFEVYNTSFHLEPRRPIIERYFAELCRLQREAGGHPDVAARLPLYAARAGLRVERFHLPAIVGDARDAAGRTALLRYFEQLLRSAAPEVSRAGALSAGEIEEVWRAFDELVAHPDALLFYTPGHLEARRDP
jgi:SAM-dependent methyltransferase